MKGVNSSDEPDCCTPRVIANYESAGMVAHYLGTDDTWDFFMDVEEEMLPRYVEWLDEYEIR